MSLFEMISRKNNGSTGMECERTLFSHSSSTTENSSRRISAHQVPRNAPHKKRRSFYIPTCRQAGLLALTAVAMFYNLSLMRQIDHLLASSNNVHTTIAGPNQDFPGLLQTPSADSFIDSLLQTVKTLQTENEQMKQALQQTQQQLQRDNNNSPREHQRVTSLAITAGRRKRNILADGKVTAFVHALNHSTPLPDGIPLDYTTSIYNVHSNSQKSSVDYHACCGLGHRLSRMSAANYVAQRLNLGLRGYWGFCGDHEVFYYLFGPQRDNMLANVTDTGQYLKIGNGVKGMNNFARWATKGQPCDNRRCGFDKADMDIAFYKDLIERFRFSPHVNKFRDMYFQNKTVLGVHIRAGNGEGGDFVWKGRVIKNETVWVANLAEHITSIAASTIDPILFVATDTERMINMLRQKLDGVMAVLHVEQPRPESGQGIMFGERASVLTEGENCLHGWEMSLVDMILLSYADVVIVGRPSSFTQTMPMSMMYARPLNERRIAKPYCELDPEATEMRCFSSYSDWCCNGKTAFYLDQKKKQEYIQIPHVPFDLEEHKGGLHLRSADTTKCQGHPANGRQYCIPYHWGSYRVLPNRTMEQLPVGTLLQQAL